METLQKGLKCRIRSFTMVGKSFTHVTLISEEGYCFYDKDALIFDKEKGMITNEKAQPSQRIYMRCCKTLLNDVEKINQKYISVKIEPNFHIK